ncbi:MAG: SufD family Fe-S cluster assembly protein [Lachnospiraceae bacterium]|nr:SufD family Fe-S cluster assembly protein [Lachnospiraceae bacterium]
MSEQTVVINHLPAPTWNWLRINDATVAVPAELLTYVAGEEIPADISKEIIDGNSNFAVATGFGANGAKIFGEVGETASYTVSGNVVEPLRLDYDFSDGANCVNTVDFHVPDDSEMLVIQHFHSEKNGFGFAGVQSKYEVGKNAKLTLVQIQMLGDDLTFCNDIGGTCDESGEFRLIQLTLSGKQTYIGSNCALAGKRSCNNVDMAYIVSDDHVLDMNYVADHTGKKTACVINAAGVLRNQAKKVFRGTIDFKRGCAGATGAEVEDVLLMDDGVINQTIPLILCSEEDVEGTHGATIGKLNDDLLFYLESRGLDLKEIYEMMARARVDAVCNLIPDVATRELVENYLGKEEED